MCIFVSGTSLLQRKSRIFQSIVIKTFYAKMETRLLDYIPTTYHETFIKFFKFLFVYGVVEARKLRNLSPSSLELLNTPDLNQKKVK